MECPIKYVLRSQGKQKLHTLLLLCDPLIVLQTQQKRGLLIRWDFTLGAMSLFGREQIIPSKLSHPPGQYLTTAIDRLFLCIKFPLIFCPFPILSQGVIVTKEMGGHSSLQKYPYIVRRKGNLEMRGKRCTPFLTQLYFFTINEEGFLKPSFSKKR